MHTPMLLDNYSQKTSLIKQISLNEKFSVINLIKGWGSRSGEEWWVVCVCVGVRGDAFHFVKIQSPYGFSVLNFVGHVLSWVSWV